MTFPHEFEPANSDNKARKEQNNMRIGTWNVENRPLTQQHKKLILDQACDVWLLTEVHAKWAEKCGTKIMHFNAHLSKEVMGMNKYWATVLSVLPLEPLESPHEASAAAIIDGITYCSTILPWRGVKADLDPWHGTNHPEMTENTLKTLLRNLPKDDLVWGGDWNHSLIGEEYAGTLGGRNCLLAALDQLGLNVPTMGLLHRGNYCKAIDHIGVPLSWRIDSAKRIPSQGLSDHDAYVVECFKS